MIVWPPCHENLRLLIATTKQYPYCCVILLCFQMLGIGMLLSFSFPFSTPNSAFNYWEPTNLQLSLFCSHLYTYCIQVRWSDIFNLSLLTFKAFLASCCAQFAIISYHLFSFLLLGCRSLPKKMLEFCQPDLLHVMLTSNGHAFLLITFITHVFLIP